MKAFSFSGSSRILGSCALTIGALLAAPHGPPAAHGHRDRGNAGPIAPRARYEGGLLPAPGAEGVQLGAGANDVEIGAAAIAGLHLHHLSGLASPGNRGSVCATQKSLGVCAISTTSPSTQGRSPWFQPGLRQPVSTP